MSKCSKKNGGMSKGHRKQSEGACQHWSNLGQFENQNNNVNTEYKNGSIVVFLLIGESKEVKFFFIHKECQLISPMEKTSITWLLEGYSENNTVLYSQISCPKCFMLT